MHWLFFFIIGAITMFGYSNTMVKDLGQNIETVTFRHRSHSKSRGVNKNNLIDILGKPIETRITNRSDQNARRTNENRYGNLRHVSTPHDESDKQIHIGLLNARSVKTKPVQYMIIRKQLISICFCLRKRG